MRKDTSFIDAASLLTLDDKPNVTNAIKCDGSSFIKRIASYSQQGAPNIWRALSTHTTHVEPNGDNGYFNKPDDNARTSALIEETAHLLEGLPDGPFPSRENDLDALRAGIDRSGTCGWGFIDTGSSRMENTFVPDEWIKGKFNDSVNELISVYRTIKSDMRPYSIISGVDRTTSFNYKLGSAYGTFAYVPGSHPANLLSLTAHWILARLWYLDDYRTHPDELARELQPELQLPALASLLFFRSGPLGQGGIVRQWSYDRVSNSLTSDGGWIGKFPKPRIVSAVPAFENMQGFQGSLEWANLLHSVPGHHATTLEGNGSMLFEISSKLSGHNRYVYCIDQSNFDQHINGTLFDGADRLRVSVFADTKDGDRWMKQMDYRRSMPLLTAYNDREEGKIDFFAIKTFNQVRSGEDSTFVKDTQVNEICLVTLFSIVQSISAKQAIQTCANYKDITRNGFITWGFAIKGDDTWLVTNFPLDWKEVIDTLSLLGLKTKREKGSILLQNFYDFRQVITYNDFYTVKQDKDKKGFLGYGLLGRRVTNKLYPEASTNSQLIAKVGLADSLIGCRKSPLVPYFKNIIQYLYDKVGTGSLSELVDEVTSSSFRDALKKETESLGSQDRYVNDLVKRFNDPTRGSILSSFVLSPITFDILATSSGIRLDYGGVNKLISYDLDLNALRKKGKEILAEIASFN